MPAQHIQLVEFDTSHPINEVRDRIDEWLKASRGKRTLQMAIAAAEQGRPNHYWEILEWPSAEEAQKSAELSETKAALDKWATLVDGEPVFHDLEVFEQLGGPSAAPVDSPVASTPGGG